MNYFTYESHNKVQEILKFYWPRLYEHEHFFMHIYIFNKDAYFTTLRYLIVSENNNYRKGLIV